MNWDVLMEHPDLCHSGVYEWGVLDPSSDEVVAFYLGMAGELPAVACMDSPARAVQGRAGACVHAGLTGCMCRSGAASAAMRKQHQTLETWTVRSRAVGCHRSH